MRLDDRVIQLLGLDPEKTTVSSSGAGGCSSASTSKIYSIDENGREKQFFMKSGTGADAEIMIRGRYYGP
jgi:protein-ribulosamine 3-kinase